MKIFCSIKRKRKLYINFLPHNIIYFEMKIKSSKNILNFDLCDTILIKFLYFQFVLLISINIFYIQYC